MNFLWYELKQKEQRIALLSGNPEMKNGILKLDESIFYNLKLQTDSKTSSTTESGSSPEIRQVKKNKS